MKQGLYEAFAVAQYGEAIDISVCPSSRLPHISSGMGGADKADKPHEKRPTANASDPHAPVRMRNKPHGPPDGPWCFSINDMFGPKRIVEGVDSSLIAFPDPETKPTSEMVTRGPPSNGVRMRCVIGDLARPLCSLRLLNIWMKQQA